MTKILFKNGNVFYHGKLQKLDVLIEEKKIIEINENIDVADKVIPANAPVRMNRNSRNWRLL